MLPSTDSSLLSGVGERGREEEHRCIVVQSEHMEDKAPGEKLCTFVVKQTVVGEDKPPPLPQLQTGAILQEEED